MDPNAAPSIPPSSTPPSSAAPSTTIAGRDPRLGMFVWWDLDKSQVKPDQMRAILDTEITAFEAAHPGTECPLRAVKVPDIDPASAIKKGVQTWTMGRGNAPRYKAEVVRSEAHTLYVGILKHERQGEKEVAWVQVELLVYALDKKAWMNQSPSEVGAAFIQEANGFLEYLDHRFLRPELIIPQIHLAKGVSLRKQGGIYFVPKVFADQLAAVRRVIQAIGNSSIHVVTVEGDAQAATAIGAAAKDHVMEQMISIRERLQEWSDSKRKIRSDAQANTLAELADLLSLASLYESTLQVSLADLQTEVKAAQDRAMRILSGEEV